jgi:flagellar basal-body rod protein FlgB
MFVDRLLNQGSVPVLEQMLRFTDTRARALGEDIVNASTPNYVQKDLSLPGFEKILDKKVQEQQTAPPGSVRFDDITSAVENSKSGILFHDGNNRSMEQLMSDQAKNALMHSMAVELLRSQFSTLQLALKERVS